MVIHLVAYRRDKILVHECFEWTGIKDTKTRVKAVPALADCCDVFFGAFPSREIARVRRVNGSWRWAGLELMAKEAGLCRAS